MALIGELYFALLIFGALVFLTRWLFLVAAIGHKSTGPTYRCIGFCAKVAHCAGVSTPIAWPR